jgi:hypothetical protein
VLVGISAVVVPAIVLPAGVRASTQKGMQAATDVLCAARPDAAVVVLQDNGLDQVMTQTIRSWCDVAAGATTSSTPSRRQLDAQWRQLGRQLVVVGTDPARHRGRPVPVVDIQVTNPRELEQTLTQVPSHYVIGFYRFVVGRPGAT